MSRIHVKNSLFLAVLSGMSALILVGCAEMRTMYAQTNEPISALKPAEIPAETQVASVRPRPPIVNNKHMNLSNLNLNNKGNLITIKPGKSIQATVNYAYNCSECKQGLGNQIIVGLAKRSAQACIYNGGMQAQGSSSFTIRVPAKPGRYDVRFRGLQALDCIEALKAGWGAEDSPSKETTIGTITVSRKAEA